MAMQSDFLQHFTPLLLISGLSHDSTVQLDHPLLSIGEPFARSSSYIELPVGHELGGRFKAKSNEVKLYEHLALKASKKKLNHLINVEFIDNVGILAREIDQQGWGFVFE